MSKVEAYKNLIRQFYAKSLRGDSKIHFAQYLEDPEFLEAWEQLIDDDELDHASASEPDDDQLFDKIKSDFRIKEYLTTVPEHKKIISKKAFKIAIAALILCTALGSFLIWNIDHKKDKALVSNTQDRVVPGKERAQIILENGQVIDLDKIKGDTVIDNGSFEILKLADGSISYRMKKGDLNENKIAYNTIVTPRGGEYNLKLPDGTRVWLNAMTTLRYPIMFDKIKREIYLQGEAYFDVMEQQEGSRRIPFVIHTGGQALEVLGTEFNLQNYGQDIITTLVEGKVKLNFADSRLDDEYLTPAEQSIFYAKANKVTKSSVDPYYFTAWKDGKFAFSKTSIQDVMGIISRWYDVDVIYNDKIENFEFSGTISRYEDFRKLLKTIELVGGIHFEIKGRKVYVKN
jgi:hypothetical protein